MVIKKYRLTEETIIINGKTLYRIEALKDFNDVKKGDKGGFVEDEENLSQCDDCWIYDNAEVFGKAKIRDKAMVYDNAMVCDDARVYGDAVVCDKAKVYDNALVCDKATISGYAEIFYIALVCDNAKVYGNAEIFDSAQVYGDAVVYGYTMVFGNAMIYGNAIITTDSDYIVFKNWWSSGRYFTWTKSNDMWKVGCFYGTGEELIDKAYKDSELSGREYKRVVDYVNSILKANECDSIRKNIKERLLSKMRKLFGR